MPRALLVVAFVVVALLQSKPCAAAKPAAVYPVDLRLEYGFRAGVKPCLSAEDFRAILAMQTYRRDPFDHAEAKELRTAVQWRAVRVQIGRKGGGYSGTVTALDAQGDEVWSKDVTTARCEDVVDGLAFLLSLGLDPVVAPTPAPAPAPVLPPPTPSVAPAPAPAPPPAPLPSAAPPVRLPAPARPEPSRPPLRLGAGAFLALGRAPAGPSPGILVSAELGGSFFSMALDMRALLPVVPFVADSTNTTFRFSAFSGVLAPCGKIAPIFICIPLELGIRDFSSSSAVATKVRDPLLASIGARIGGELSFARRYILKGYVDATGMLTPAALELDGVYLWRESGLSCVVSLSLAMKLDAGD